MIKVKTYLVKKGLETVKKVFEKKFWNITSKKYWEQSQIVSFMEKLHRKYFFDVKSVNIYFCKKKSLMGVENLKNIE